METNLRTPRELFYMPQFLRIPLYQRPYVWDEEKQWQPLWDDVRRLAELRMGTAPSATHFLGAIVTQTQGMGAGSVSEFTLVDGQQRVTTLQLMMDAAAGQLERSAGAGPARQLRDLVRNPSQYGFEGTDLLKVHHSNSDGDPYQSVMLSDSPVDSDELDTDHLIVQAHRYFSTRIGEWMAAADGSELDLRAAALADSLMTGLQLVVISLGKEEDSQAIFETLNARGTPLTQADLVKNLVFQKLGLEGMDTRQAYEQHWAGFDHPFWTEHVTMGRFTLPRLSLFLNHWLVAHTGEEVRTGSTFARFKHWVDYVSERPMHQILEVLHRQATAYRGWLEGAEAKDGLLGPTAMFVYRTQAAGLETVKPILLHLFDDESEIPTDVANQSLAWVESWILRRAVLRLPMADVSRVVALLIRELRAAEPSDAAERTKSFLMQQDRRGTYWPSDQELQDELAGLPLYRQLSRSRLRMVLEAIEDDARGFTSTNESKTGSRVSRGTMHIEHILPRQWKHHWPVTELQEEIDRNAHVHRLGNLTLLTRGLNSSVSNGSWLGPQGKRSSLDQHDVLLINRPLQKLEAWDEAAIVRRGQESVAALIRTWPAPAGHHVVPVSARDVSEEAANIQFREVVGSGLIVPGTILRGRGDASMPGEVTKEGRIRVNGKDLDTPSGAGKAVLGHSVNGWAFWRLPDGRRIRELKPAFLQWKESQEPGADGTIGDWSGRTALGEVTTPLSV